VLALGSAHLGLEGFRRSHAEAVRVHHVGVLNSRSNRALLAHDEPGMAATALLAQVPEVARDWVLTALGDLAVDDEQTATKRETLLCFLRHDRSYTATAEAMLMHKNSIKYRIEIAERDLGRNSRENRLDVELALNACHWLGPAVLR
jgi:DNA-binding PucR family transcriptional regulator